MQSITFTLRTHRIHTVFIGFAPYAHLNRHFVAGIPSTDGTNLQTAAQNRRLCVIYRNQKSKIPTSTFYTN